MMICASPDYLATHGTPQTPDDLGQHSIITGGQSERIWWMKKQHLQPKVKVVVEALAKG